MSSMFGSIAKSNANKLKKSPSLSPSTTNRHTKSHSKLNKTLNTNQSPSKNPSKTLQPQTNTANIDENFSKGMKKIRDKLSTTLDAHYLVFETGAPIRCLEHNSVISLYCETQQKLLCANCVYRSPIHKMHKVFPVQKCDKALARDIQLVERQCDREVSWLEETEKTIQNHFKDEEKAAQETLYDLANMFDEIRYELDKSFEEIRKNILFTLQGLCFKQESILLELGFFKEIFKRNKLPNQSQIPNLNERTILYHHSVAMTLLQFGKVEGKKLNPGPSIIRQIQKQEQKRLKQILEEVKRMGTENSQYTRSPRK